MARRPPLHGRGRHRRRAGPRLGLPTPTYLALYGSFHRAGHRWSAESTRALTEAIAAYYETAEDAPRIDVGSLASGVVTLVEDLRSLLDSLGRQRVWGPDVERLAARTHAA